MKPENPNHPNDSGPSSSSVDGTDAAIPGQATVGQDRREVDSDQARQSHEVRPGGAPGADQDVPRSEEAKNQEATSQQSRAVSGTTAPRQV